MNKKNIPLVVQQIVNNIAIKKPNLFRLVISEENFTMLLKEKEDSESNFYFSLMKISINEGKTLYNIDYLPCTSEHLKSSGGLLCDISLFTQHIERWVELLEEYNKESPVFEDIISKRYFDELDSGLEIKEEDASYAPFNYHQQELLLSIYEKTINWVKEKENEQNTSESQLIIAEINEAEKSIGKDTKKQAIDRLKNVLVKLRKLSFETFKTVLVEVLSETCKKLLLG